MWLIRIFGLKNEEYGPFFGGGQKLLYTIGGGGGALKGYLENESVLLT